MLGVIERYDLWISLFISPVVLFGSVYGLKGGLVVLHAAGVMKPFSHSNSLLNFLVYNGYGIL